MHTSAQLFLQRPMSAPGFPRPALPLVLAAALGLGLAPAAGAASGGSACPGNPSLLADTPDANLVDNGDGTVTHTLTGLMWAQCANGRSTTNTPCDTGQPTRYTWSEALAASRVTTLAGHRDWRLPNKKELESIAELCRFNPAINTHRFPNTDMDGGYWTSSTIDSNYPPDTVWAMNFYHGASVGSLKNDPNNTGYLRLVRGGGVGATDAAPPLVDAFSFPPKTGVAVGAVVVSDAMTVSGVSSTAAITVTGGSYGVNGGSDTTAPGKVKNGDTVRVKQTAAATFSTTTTATLTIADLSADFNVTTADPDTTPDPFTVAPKTGVPVGSTVDSDPITVTGINSPADISVKGGSYALNGGPFTSANGQVNNGDRVVLRQTADANPSATTRLRVTLGGVSANFDVTTADPVLPTLTYTGYPAVGPGPVTVTLNGGGSQCGFSAAGFVAAVGGGSVTTPPGINLPYGLFNFTLGGCTPGSTVALTLTYPQPLPTGVAYWKYGPTPGQATPHWYTVPVQVEGRNLTLTIQDGGLGDDDLRANGSIVDAGGPGITAPVAATPAPIPAASPASLTGLAGLILALFWRRNRRGAQ